MQDFNSLTTQVSNYWKKVLRKLLHILTKTLDFGYYIFTGKEREHFSQWFLKKAQKTVEAGKEATSVKYAKKQIKMDGNSKTCVSKIFNDNTMAFMCMEELRQQGVKFLVRGINEKGKEKDFTIKQNKEIAELETQYIGVKEKYKNCLNECGKDPTNKRLIAKKNSAYERMSELEKILNKHSLYSFKQIEIIVNSSRKGSLDKVEQKVALERLQDYTTFKQHKLFEIMKGNDFTKETLFKNNGSYGPMSASALGNSYLITKIEKETVNELQSMKDINTKPFAIERTNDGLFLIMPDNTEDIKEMVKVLQECKTFEKDYDFQRIKNGNIYIPKENNKYVGSLEEWEKQKKYVLEGTTYETTIRVVNGEPQIVITDLMQPDGSTGDRALGRVADQIQKNKDREKFEIEKSMDILTQEALLNRAGLELNGNEIKDGFSVLPIYESFGLDPRQISPNFAVPNILSRKPHKDEDNYTLPEPEMVV